jgi:hypothetical protein
MNKTINFEFSQTSYGDSCGDDYGDGCAYDYGDGEGDGDFGDGYEDCDDFGDGEDYGDRDGDGCGEGAKL